MRKKIRGNFQYEIKRCPESSEWIVYRLVYMSVPIQFTRATRSEAIALRFQLNRELRAEVV